MFTPLGLDVGDAEESSASASTTEVAERIIARLGLDSEVQRSVAEGGGRPRGLPAWMATSDLM